MKKSWSLRMEFNSKIFISILKSILMIIPLPIIILIIVELISLHLIENTVTDFEKIIFDKVADELNENYESAYQIMYNVKSNESINEYLKNDERNYWQEYKIYQQLNEIIEGRYNIEELFIYFPEYEYVLSTYSGMDSRSYHKKHYNNSYDEWKELLEKNNEDGSWVVVEKDAEKNNMLICDIGYDNSARLVLMMKNDYLLKILKSMCYRGSDEAFIIWDDKMIVSTKKLENDDQIAEQLMICKENNEDRVEIDGTVYHLKIEQASKKGFTLVYAMPEDMPYVAVHISKVFGFGAIFLCIIILIGTSVLATNKNYAPIKRLFGMLKEDDWNEQEIDYGTMEHYVKNSLERKEQMQLKLQKYENDVKQLYLGKILISGMVSKIEASQIASWGFIGDYYVVLLYEFESSEIEKNISAKEDYRNDILQEYIEEYMEDYTCCYMVEHEKKVYCILNGSGETKQHFIEDIKECNEEIRFALTKMEGLYCDAYISNCYDNLDEVHQGYKEVNQMKKEQISSELKSEVQEDICTIEKITEIINENLSDINLSVASLAELLNISPSYLSRFFKSKMGIGVLEYIHMQRVELTKKMLVEDKELKIKEAAEAAGFFNISTFIRVFKKVEGITPGQFRESIQDKKLENEDE